MGAGNVKVCVFVLEFTVYKWKGGKRKYEKKYTRDAKCNVHVQKEKRRITGRL